MHARQLWQAVLDDLQGRLSRNAFENWLRHTIIVGFDDDVATVAAANTFSASTLQARYASQVERALSDLIGRPIKVRFTVLTADLETHLAGDDASDDAPEPDGDATTVLEPVANESPERSAAVKSRQPSRARSVSVADGAARANGREPDKRLSASQQLPLAATPTHGLNPRYIYETYVVGSSNRFAHAASLSVAERPGGKYNPFYVYGGVGLGKTHLLHAIGHRALETQPNLNIVYVSSEKFTNDLINALRARSDMEEFRAKYRSIDILMIDDIQFIAGKEATMEEFFHTFNTLQQSGKQVVITSDKVPKAIEGLEERLRSRFEGGLMADVQAPDYEMRMAILRTKGDELGVALPTDVAEYVAGKDRTNIRELEGALTKILFRGEVTGQPVSLSLAMESLADTAPGARRGSLTPHEVVDAVSKHFGVARKDITGRARTKQVVTPRQVAMYLIREETGASLAEIGQELGGRDHTTVMHGIGKVERDLSSDTTLRTQVITIREALLIGG